MQFNIKCLPKMASKDASLDGITCMYEKCKKKGNKLLASSERVEVKSYVPAAKVEHYILSSLKLFQNSKLIDVDLFVKHIHVSLIVG